MTKQLSVFLSFLLLLSSCYTIHFSKRPLPSASYPHSQWHHIGLFGLVEFSNPVNLERICPHGSWESVRVRTGFLQALARSIPIAFLFETQRPTSLSFNGNMPIGGTSGLFYSPEEVSVSCKNR